MNQHTKGEWLFNMLNDIGIKGEEQPICHIFARANPDEAEANAQLIAKSPRMYEALKEISTNLHNMSRDTIKYIVNEALEEI